MSHGMEMNPNYQVRIVQKNGPGITAFVPETFQFAVTSQFGQPFGQGLMNSAAGNAAKVGLSTALTSQVMTAQVWEGSQPIEITLELEFAAESDPIKEIREPIMHLLEMTMPSSDGVGGLLKPPGPKYLDLINWQAFEAKKGAGQADKQIDVFIGKFLSFDNVVIESVNATFQSMMHESGIPLRATVAVTFKTFFVPIKEDIANIFKGG
jgi:hypothetical protein